VIIFNLSYYFLLFFFSPKSDIYIAPSGILPFFLRKKTKKVLFVHDLIWAHEKNSFLKKFIAWLHASSIRRADFIICVSDSTKKELQHFFPFKGNVSTLHNSFDWSLTKRKKIQPDSIFILSVGLTSLRKSPELCFKIARQLYFDRGIIWKITGDKKKIVELFESIKIDIMHIPFADLLGVVSDTRLKDLYFSATLSLILSEREGFGYPILEAQSMGSPILASNIAIFREISGLENNFLCNISNEREVYKKAIKLLEDKKYRETQQSIGFENIKKYMLEITRDKLKNLIRNNLFK
tara:strand:- start:6685 stop:7569 length:885 start_codon:yes stop_codon:yes gene_type:complete